MHCPGKMVWSGELIDLQSLWLCAAICETADDHVVCSPTLCQIGVTHVYTHTHTHTNDNRIDGWMGVDTYHMWRASDTLIKRVSTVCPATHH